MSAILRFPGPREVLECGWLGAILVVLALWVPAAGVAQQAGAPPAGRLALEMYMDLEGVADPRISPDGSRVAYVRSWVDRMSDSRESAIWTMGADGGANRYLTEGSSPRWSPSGDHLAFLACGTAGGDRSALDECEGGARQQIYVRTMSGPGEGTITQVTRLTEDAASIQWSPDGSRIALLQFVPEASDWTISLPGKPEGATWTADARIVDQLDYRQDGRGFDRSGHTHVFTVPATGGTPRQITFGPYDHGSPQWSRDGRTIYFDGLRDARKDYLWYAGSYMGRPSKVYSVDVATREVRQLTHTLGVDEGPIVSPDGRSVAYLASDSTDHTYVLRTLYVMNSDGSGSRPISAGFDRRIRNPMWAPDGRGVYFVAEDSGARNLYYAPTEGEVRQVTEGSHDLAVTSLGPRGMAVGTLSAPHLVSEVVSLDLARPNLRQLTNVNDDVLADVELGEVEDFWYDSVDGFRVQGWIVKPPDFDPGQKYPLVLSIHGGPHGMYDFGFDFSFQHFAAQGYVVVYTNPRGSSGYGTQFGDGINNAWPGKDFDDLMNGVDAVVDQGYVDPDNMFVMGCSGGGTLTAWVVTQTTRFAGASARCPISNFISFVGTTDGTSWYRNFATFPWEDASEHLQRSPLMHVENVTTPTLVMVGEWDLRTPVPQAEEFYAALKFLGVPTKLILVKEEWHGTSRKPSNFLRTELFQMKWFEEHMTAPMRQRRRPVTDSGASR